MNRVVHFEIHAADPERAMAFYRSMFGWQFQPYGPPDFYWLLTTGPDGTPGINGGLVRRIGANPGRDAATPVTGFVCTIDVEDVDAAVAKALATGGSLALAKNAIPGVGWVAYVKDTESNILGLYKNDPTAK